MRRHLIAVALLLLGPGAAVLTQQALAQSTPFLTDDEIRMISNEISGDRAFEHIRWLTHWHRNSGSDGYFKAADYIVQAAKEAGLEDVRFIEQPLMRRTYNARSAELWMVEPVELKLADIGEHAVYLADGSHSADVTAELVWIRDASPAGLKDLDVKGKIVLTNASPYSAVRNAVWEKGAVGVVSYETAGGKDPWDYPDQIGWKSVPSTPPEGKQGTFAFILPPRKGETLRRILETDQMQDYFGTGKRTKGGRVVLKANVATEFGENPGRTGFVEGWIRGSKYHDQQVVLTAHIQEEQGSANDDGSGCGNLLELARAFTKLIREGKMQRPLRDLRFWWTDEIYSEYRYFSDHPEESKNMLASLNQDMTGANLAIGDRVQHLILAPHSRTSFLDAIFESIGTFVIQTNTAYLAASRGSSSPRTFTRPLFSTRGTHQGYNARFVPWFGSSDHIVFLEGAIGIPAVAMINWDDDFIHSTDDDLDKIDQTQLRRNNFIIGSTAYVLAFAEEKDIPTIAGETFAQGMRRLANDLRVAMEMLQMSATEPDDKWKDASIIIEQGVQREVRALNSSRAFVRTDKVAAQTIDDLVQRMKRKQEELTADLQAYYRRLHGNKPKSVKLSPEEVAATKKVPANVPSLMTYFQNRMRGASPANLHYLMRSEVFNFVDGTRSYYDIYKAVFAEAAAAGSWYYGTVTLEDVSTVLDAAVKANALIMK
ncbi:MAG: M28 family peptidase [Ignavibacteria bacterium]|nr:M28 family peptidase [Ignavibacteria bacterium]